MITVIYKHNHSYTGNCTVITRLSE